MASGALLMLKFYMTVGGSGGGERAASAFVITLSGSLESSWITLNDCDYRAVKASLNHSRLVAVYTQPQFERGRMSKS